MSIQALTKAHIKAFQKAKPDAADPTIILKMFDPRGGSTWYFTELETDPASEDYGMGFGFVKLNDWTDSAECGGIYIFEILNIRRRHELTPRNTPDLCKVRIGAADSSLCIERDIHFKIGKHKLSEVMEKIKAGGHV